MTNGNKSSIVIDGSPLSSSQIEHIARGQATAILSDDPGFRARIERGAQFLERVMREDGVI